MEKVYIMYHEKQRDINTKYLKRIFLHSYLKSNVFVFEIVLVINGKLG